MSQEESIRHSGSGYRDSLARLSLSKALGARPGVPNPFCYSIWEQYPSVFKLAPVFQGPERLFGKEEEVWAVQTERGMLR